MPKFFIFLIIFCSSNSTIAQSSKALETIYSFQGDEDLKHASWALQIKNLDQNENLISINAQQSLIPASTLKTITTGMALDQLGAEFQFSTKLQYSGRIDNGVLNGDLIIKGGSDPTLGTSIESRDIVNQWLRAITNLNITEVNGEIIADLSALPNTTPATWTYEDLGNYYGASPSALSYKDNTFQIVFRRAKTPGESTKVLNTIPFIPNLNYNSQVIGGAWRSGDQAYVFGTPESNNYTIRGTLPPGQGTYTIKASMPRPDEVLLYEFSNQLKKYGIALSGTRSASIYKTDRNLTLVQIIDSPPLKDIIREVNVNSNNLYAEHLRLAITTGSQTTNECYASFFKSNNLDFDGFRPMDGSGLSRYNVISVNQQINFLEFMYKKSQYFDDYYASFPIGGKDGTVHQMFESSHLKGRIRIKSGTLSGVKAFCGYLKTLNGEMIAFSFIVNNFNGSSYAMAEKMEKVLVSFMN